MPGHAATLTSYLAAYNDADWSALRSFLAPGYVHNNSGEALDVEGFLDGAAMMRTAFPDIRIDVLDLLVDGDRAAVRFLVTGTHEGPLGGTPPTGRRLAVEGVTVYRMAGDLVAEDWEFIDVSWLGAQLTG